MIADSRVVLKVEKNDHTYEFHMPMGVNYGETYDAAFQILGDILKLAQQAADAAKRAPEVTAEISE